MKCHRCGHPMKFGEEKCRKCGAKVKKTEEYLRMEEERAKNAKRSDSFSSFNTYFTICTWIWFICTIFQIKWNYKNVNCEEN